MELTYEQSIVDRAKRISVDINDYFEEQRYKQFTDEYQQEEITDRYLLNVAIELILSELKDMGIESDYTADDLIDDPNTLNTAFALREKFDKDNFFEVLKNFTENDFADFQAVYESIELPEDLLLELAPWLSEKFPNDPNWNLVLYAPNNWYSTNYFADHLSDIIYIVIEKTDRNKAVVNDSNIESISRFLQLMNERSEKLKVYVSHLLKTFSDLNETKLNDYIDHYDQQKLNNDLLPLFAAYNDVKPEVEPSFVKSHHLTVNHHIEYWIDKKNKYDKYKVPMPEYTKEIAVMIVLSLVLDNLPSDIMKQKILPLKEIVSDELYTFTDALTILNYNAILIGDIQ